MNFLASTETDLFETQILSFNNKLMRDAVFSELQKTLKTKSLHISTNKTTNNYEIHFAGKTMSEKAQEISTICARLNCTLYSENSKAGLFFSKDKIPPKLLEDPEQPKSVLKKKYVEFKFLMSPKNQSKITFALSQFGDQISQILFGDGELTIQVRLKPRQSSKEMHDLLENAIRKFCFSINDTPIKRKHSF